MHELLTPSSFPPPRVLVKERSPLKKGRALFHLAGAICAPPLAVESWLCRHAHASSFPWPKGTCVLETHSSLTKGTLSPADPL